MVEDVEAQLDEILDQATDGLDTYEKAKQVSCPYKNCGAGVGMQCLVHHKGNEAPSIRDNPHASRVRKAERVLD